MSKLLELDDEDFRVAILVKVNAIEVLIGLIWEDRLLSDDASFEEAVDAAEDLKGKVLSLVPPTRDPFDKMCRIALEGHLDSIIQRLKSSL